MNAAALARSCKTFLMEVNLGVKRVKCNPAYVHSGGLNELFQPVKNHQDQVICLATSLIFLSHKNKAAIVCSKSNHSHGAQICPALYSF